MVVNTASACVYVVGGLLPLYSISGWCGVRLYFSCFTQSRAFGGIYENGSTLFFICPERNRPANKITNHIMHKFLLLFTAIGFISGITAYGQKR